MPWSWLPSFGSRKTERYETLSHRFPANRWIGPGIPVTETPPSPAASEAHAVITDSSHLAGLLIVVDTTRRQLAHLYRRAGFGARPEELDAAVARGYEATVDLLLAGLDGPDPGGDQVAGPAVSLNPGNVGPLPTDPQARQAAARQRQMDQNRQYLALQRWWIERMIATTTPLREKLVLLWSEHFATGFSKVRVAGWMYRQNQLFRTMGAGSFEALAQAVAKDPAMQLWLDTTSNVAGKPNENFARELMELFTLGVGNYSEADVQQAARCFTGWAFNRMTGAFVLRALFHDRGVKTCLGQTGAFDGTDVVRIVTHEAASPRFVIAKLWSRLAYPVKVSDPIVDLLQGSTGADLEIRALLRAIFLRPEFVSTTARQGLVKQPIEYLVGVGRAFGLPAAVRAASPAVLQAQQPFNPPSVGGWGQNQYWLNTATAEARLQLGLQVAGGADLSALVALPAAQRLDALANHLSVDGWGQTTAAALNHVVSNPKALVAVALSAPEYVLN
jgi:uncharacterized protein (DUF1800 family)